MTDARTDFGDPAEEARCALGGVALADGSAFSRLIGVGPDLLGLLQRLSTGDVAGLTSGAGRATVLTTNKGRIVQRLFVSHLGDAGILLLAGTGGADVVLEHLKRYTFAEDTGLGDVTGETAMLLLTGPHAATALGNLGIEPTPTLGARRASVADIDAHVVGSDGTSADGYALIVPAADREAVWAAALRAVESAGGRAVGSAAIEAARVLRGLGAHGHELTLDYNPLEAGERNAVSFTKGCYVGQEVVARLENYDKVSRTLVGIEYPAGQTAPTPGAALYRAGREVGRVTSALVPAGLGRGVGLAYVKHRDAAPGDSATVGIPDGVEVGLVALPFPEATTAAPAQSPPS